jgi:hypothetical protein
MDALDLAIQLSDLFESSGMEGSEVTYLIDAEIIPNLSMHLAEADGIGLGARFAKVLGQVRGIINQNGGDIRSLKTMMKTVLDQYVKRTQDALTARHIFSNAIMGGMDTMLAVTAGGLLANALAGQHPRQAVQMLQTMGKHVTGQRPRMQENASMGAVSAGSFATVPTGKRKVIKRTQPSIFAELAANLQPDGMPERPQGPQNPESAWSGQHQVPPDIRPMHAAFDKMLNGVGVQGSSPPPTPPEQFDLQPLYDAALQYGWKHVDTETYPEGEIMVFDTPSRHGSNYKLYLYSGGEWKFANQKGGPGSFIPMLQDHDKTRRKWESIEWDDETMLAEGGHLRMSASPQSSSRPSFTTDAGSHDEAEHHLSNLHAHVAGSGLEPHNVSIHNTRTGVVHQAKVAPHGVYKRSYNNLDESMTWADIQDPDTVHMQIIREVAGGVGNRVVGGVLIDPTTAEMVVATYLALSPDRQTRYAGKNVSEMVRIAEKIFEKGGIEVVMEEG